MATTLAPSRTARPVGTVRAGLGRSRRAVRLSFASALLLLLLAIGAATAVSFRVADNDVSYDAVQAAQRLAETGVGPELVPALGGDTAARARLDATVATRMADGAISQVTVWTPDGVVLYSSRPEIVGRRARDDTPYRAAIARGAYTQIDSTDREFGDVPRAQRVVEVHVPVPVAADRLVLELHYNTDEIEHQVTSVALPLIALSVLPLLLLQLAQTPVVLSLLRRMRTYEGERARVAEYALTASERERRDIAAGVHDTVVQDLAGVTYALSSLERHLDPERRASARVALETLQTSVASLRGLLVELHPATITATALPAAVGTMLAAARREGLEVTSALDVPPGVDDEVALVLYRVVREALANVGAHARAGAVEIRIAADGPDVVLTVTDDGVGLDDRTEATLDGYRGLALLTDRVADLHGTLRARTRPTGGTLVEVVLPARTPTD